MDGKDSSFIQNLVTILFLLGLSQSDYQTALNYGKEGGHLLWVFKGNFFKEINFLLTSS